MILVLTDRRSAPNGHGLCPIRGDKMGLFRILKDVVVITATVAAVSTIAAPLWMLVNDMDDGN